MSSHGLSTCLVHGLLFHIWPRWSSQLVPLQQSPGLQLPQQALRSGKAISPLKVFPREANLGRNVVHSKLHPAQQSWNEKNPKNIHEPNMASERTSIVCLWREMQLTFPLPLRSSWLLNFFWWLRLYSLLGILCLGRQGKDMSHENVPASFHVRVNKKMQTTLTISFEPTGCPQETSAQPGQARPSELGGLPQVWIMLIHPLWNMYIIIPLLKPRFRRFQRGTIPKCMIHFWYPSLSFFYM